MAKALSKSQKVLYTQRFSGDKSKKVLIKLTLPKKWGKCKMHAVSFCESVNSSKVESETLGVGMTMMLTVMTCHGKYMWDF